MLTSEQRRGVTVEGQGGHNYPGVESRRGRVITADERITAGAPKSPTNVTSTCFNTVHLLPKELKFERGGAKLASLFQVRDDPGRPRALSKMTPGAI